MVLLGRILRDALQVSPLLPIFAKESPAAAEWKKTWELKEEALRVRLAKQQESLNETAKPCPPLSISDKIRFQNLSWNHPLKRDRTGTVKEVGDFDKYRVIYGCRRVTVRNRKHLKITPLQYNWGETLPKQLLSRLLPT